ncbi:uncharacterized protein BDR25DRAFT_358477 [Lindgomyces ingoldianus]|uniref:Uncharacterized protein n=1 Tax=Lindgomyces ingoldianus TaxID=673940 RepID=A0ACB6QLJ3_9PLEO|nr:uncharacterized protein BDR25DRAFT_358477 [Lindgomyces ingoldianus]KAF2467760.1 hypothetical protein BDR25DRAFT_358477 [Lindgomyces ingoldianus]
MRAAGRTCSGSKSLILANAQGPYTVQIIVQPGLGLGAPTRFQRRNETEPPQASQHRVGKGRSRPTRTDKIGMEKSRFVWKAHGAALPVGHATGQDVAVSVRASQIYDMTMTYIQLPILPLQTFGKPWELLPGEAAPKRRETHSSILQYLSASADEYPAGQYLRVEEPPRNEHNEMICGIVGCEMEIFKRRCPWNKHMDKHKRPVLMPSTEIRDEREGHEMGENDAYKRILCPIASCKRASNEIEETEMALRDEDASIYDYIHCVSRSDVFDPCSVFFETAIPVCVPYSKPHISALLPLMFGRRACFLALVPSRLENMFSKFLCGLVLGVTRHRTQRQQHFVVTQLHESNDPLWRAVESTEQESSSADLFRPTWTLGRATVDDMPDVCEVIRVRGDAVQPRARRSRTSQTLSVLYCCLGSVVALVFQNLISRCFVVFFAGSLCPSRPALCQQA